MSATTSHRAGGINFNFGVFNAGPWTKWPPGGGIYIMCRQDPITKVYEALYVGQCDSFDSRLPCHERWAEAVRQGMTHVLLTSVERKGDRDKYEVILVRDLNPPLNTHFRN